MKKILVVYASAGEGHRKAALAIYDELRAQGSSDIQITVIDSLDYTNKFFKAVYRGGYVCFWIIFRNYPSNFSSLTLTFFHCSE